MDIWSAIATAAKWIGTIVVLALFVGAVVVLAVQLTGGVVAWGALNDRPSDGTGATEWGPGTVAFDWVWRVMTGPDNPGGSALLDLPLMLLTAVSLLTVWPLFLLVRWVLKVIS